MQTKITYKDEYKGDLVEFFSDDGTYLMGNIIENWDKSHFQWFYFNKAKQVEQRLSNDAR